MLWIAALLVAWVLVDAVAVAAMARMAARRRASTPAIPQPRRTTGSGDGTAGAASVR